MFRDQIEQRHHTPGPDLITQLMNVVEEGSRLSKDDILATLIQVIVAGHDTTTNSLTLGARALALHPEAWRYWREHPDRSVQCAIELMRYIAMSTTLWRTVSRDFEWHGKPLRQGQIVMLMLAGGNRDPLAFDRPESLNFARSNDAALTFGPGLHHCIGHLLAKLQISEFFRALTQRFDGLEILEAPTPTPGLVFRSLTALKVRFIHPR
jgi:pimeloyl-[acyl-carrier protein] synthase